MPTKTKMTRRAIIGAGISFALPPMVQRAQAAPGDFAAWRDDFRSRALALGVSAATYDRVMGQVEPDLTPLSSIKAQPEFTEKTWQYLNRRVSAWRIVTGRQRAEAYGALLARIERDYGVDPFVMVGLWGNESAFGEVATDPRYMKPVIPSLAALAWAEPRRAAYWRQELVNALRIIDKGWSSPSEMVGSWAGAMGHTQWMPEVWLRMGVDYDRNGRVSPFGAPDDALAGTARYLAVRGKYIRDGRWGMEVELPAGMDGRSGARTVSEWRDMGLTAPGGGPLDDAVGVSKLWRPAPGGPVLLIGQNFAAVRAYNPSSNYTLAVLLLADRIKGDGPLAKAFPGGERALTLEETQEMQRRLTALGYDTYYTDGRVGRETLAAIRDYQQKQGLRPDGYPGLEVLAKLRGAR